MPRLDPAEPDARRVTACLTVPAERKIIELALERGVSKSAAARSVIEAGLAALDAEHEAVGVCDE